MQGDRRTVETIYARLAPIYDLVYGVSLEHGRRQAMARLAPKHGESILEIGIGTGLSATAYPNGCRVVGIDLSTAMLERAKRRFTRQRLRHVALCRMDAVRLAFPDGSFDAVYAPYVINVVPDPIEAAREMVRVCRPGGRVVLLNHFRDRTRRRHSVGQWLGRVAWHAGAANWNLELTGLLRQSGLVAISVDRVNLPRVSSVVLCRKHA